MKKYIFISLLIVAFSLGVNSAAQAATYYVSINGNDAGPGTQERPWRSIQYAANMLQPGDTANVLPGDYRFDANEGHQGTVRTKRHGAENARITFRAEPPNDPGNRVTLRGFRVDHRYITIEGFDLTKAMGPDYGHIVLYYNPDQNIDGSFCNILNNTIRDGTYLISDDFYYDHLTNSVSSQKGNFREAGFEVGASVRLGSSSLSYPENHGVNKTVRSISADGHTLYFNEALLPEKTNPWFAILYVSNDNGGWPGITILLGNSQAAHDCIIHGNTFRNLFGTNVIIDGSNHFLEDNTFENMHGFDAFFVSGSDQTVRRNTFRNSPHFIYYSPEETNLIPHLDTGEFYDFQVGLFHSYSPHDYNITIENNYFENCYNQIGMFMQNGNSYGVTFRNNVFVGFPAQLNSSRSGVRFENNTFYKATYETGSSIAAGPRSGTMTGLAIKNNAFVDVGRKKDNSIDGEGWYGVSGNQDKPDVDYNFVAGPEVLGFCSKKGFVGKELHGINGGDPLFYNADNPAGEDTIPLTEDDGLRPLPNSPLCPSAANNFTQRGAYPCLQCRDGIPFAHFAIDSPNWWIDIPDATWFTLAPEKRGRPLRPYTQADIIGYTPAEVVFNAVNSVACVTNDSKDNVGISRYAWDFGDGSAQVASATPQATHTYVTEGEYTVVLTITNTLGKTASYQRKYKVLRSVPHQALRLTFDSSLDDASGRQHVVTWEGAATYATGKVGQSAALGPSGGSAVIVNHRDDLDGLAQITFACWLNKNTAASTGYIIFKPFSYYLRLVDNGWVYATIYNNNSPSQSASINVRIPLLATDANTWHYFAVTYDGQYMKVYMDGQLLSGGTKAFSGAIARNRDRDIYIGQSLWPPASFDGMIDEMRIYDRALSEEEINTLMTTNRLPGEEETTILYGDVSGDGTISAYDAALAAQYAVGLITLTSEQITRADVSGDGSVSAYDAALIAQRAVGLISKFPIEG